MGSSIGETVVAVLAVVGGLGVGAFAWFFMEYVLHRFAFHDMKGRGLGSREHLLHHVRANWIFNPVILLAWFGVVLVGTGIGVGLTMVVGPFLGVAIGVGWTAGYFFYEWHHRAAHIRAPRNDWERWLRKNHFAHHFANPNENHQVTVRLWDRVFGTEVMVERVRVPRRLAMPWMLDDAGALRPEYADDYELVGPADPDGRAASLDRARAFANLAPNP